MFTSWLEYIAFIWDDQKQESPYQLVLETANNNSNREVLFLGNGSPYCRKILSFFNNSDIPGLLGFFEWQYGEYKNEKMDFLDFVETSISELYIPDNNGYNTDKKFIKTQPGERLLNWIGNKRSELKANESTEVEEKAVLKNRISHAKQMVLLERLKVLEYLQRAGLTRTDQAKIISLLINKDEQNTREYLIYGYQSKETKNQAKKKYFYNTQENLDFINNLLKGMNIS